MFNPSREQVRQFFIDAWARRRGGVPLTGLEPRAVDIILLHPEYHALLGDPAAAIAREYTPEHGETNPFLHLSLHLAIEEQLAIDQPAGISAEFERLRLRTANRHAALHVVLDCLAEALWAAQRSGLPPDSAGYLDCVRRS
jgi:hypothetical protein